MEHYREGNLEIVTFALGPAVTNAYLVGDIETGKSVVIDPAWEGELMVKEAADRNWRITDIWLTHAHFDHFGGAGAIADSIETPIPVALHPDDQPLWRAQGGASFFGFGTFDPGPEPTIDLTHGQHLSLGDQTFVVRHTPGHTPGHIVLYEEEAKLVFCGDLIFQGSVGRTDLPGGNWETLLTSIRDEILVLPDETALFPGHGPRTTVGHERMSNPFLTGDFP